MQRTNRAGSGSAGERASVNPGSGGPAAPTRLPGRGRWLRPGDAPGSSTGSAPSRDPTDARSPRGTHRPGGAAPFSPTLRDAEGLGKRVTAAVHPPEPGRAGQPARGAAGSSRAQSRAEVPLLSQRVGSTIGLTATEETDAGWDRPVPPRVSPRRSLSPRGAAASVLRRGAAENAEQSRFQRDKASTCKPSPRRVLQTRPTAFTPLQRVLWARGGAGVRGSRALLLRGAAARGVAGSGRASAAPALAALAVLH